jgi:hypothetical protein
MIYTKDVKDYLKSVIECENWGTHFTDSTKERFIAVYDLKTTTTMAIGGLKNNSYKTKGVSILIHYGKNSHVAEQKAYEVFDALNGQTPIINGHEVVTINMLNNPICVGTDTNGIFENVVNCNIIYK